MHVWEVQFLSDVNGGDMPQMGAHGNGLRTTHLVGGAAVEVSTARDGSYVAGNFTLSFRKCRSRAFWRNPGGAASPRDRTGSTLPNR